MLKSLSWIFEDKDDDEKVIGDNILVNLRKFIKREIDDETLIDSDPFISDVVPFTPRSRSNIYLNVTENELFEKLDVSEDDASAINQFSSGYYNFDYIDYYSATESFKEEGFLFNYFDDENKTILKEIALILIPHIKFNLNDYEYRQSLAEKFFLLFKDLSENMIDIFVSYENAAFRESMEEEINENFWKVIIKAGFINDYDKYYIDVAHLIMWCRYYEYKGNLEGLIDKICFELSGKLPRGFWDDMYSFYNSDKFDSVGFNIGINGDLNEILENLYENDNLNEKIKKIKLITDKYEYERWYQVPKSPKKSFRIEDIDIFNELIFLLINSKTITRRKLSIDDFWSFLYNYELFDDEY